MSCPTCSTGQKRLGKLGFYTAFWCPKCGTLECKPIGVHNQRSKLYVPENSMGEFTASALRDAAKAIA